MPGTTPKYGLRYPLSTEAPDGPGAFLALATDVDNLLESGGFAPSLSGGGTLGANGGSDGTYLRIGKHVRARGRLVFGSSAAWGSPGSATIRDLPLATPMDQRWASGYGRFTPSGGGAIIPVQFLPHPNSTDMWIAPIMGAAPGSATSLGSAFQLGSIPQGSTLFFTLDISLT